MTRDPGLSEATRTLIERLNHTRPGLLVDTSELGRGQFAYDASNYRVSPTAIAYPRDVDDVVAIMTVASELAVPVTVRGAGTSMAGNSIGAGLILNLARHLTRIHDIDLANRTVTVDAGTVLDQLQAEVAGHGLMFGPDPSSHSRATVGGMVGNDACGNHSVEYGRTSEHIVSLDLVLADGVRATVDNHGIRAVDPDDEPRIRTLEAKLRRLVREHLADVRLELDRTPRQVSGYHLHRLLPEHGFDVARSLAGSEGTLAVVVSMTLRLVPRPTHHSLVVLGYSDVVSAARDVPDILRFQPSAIEGMDQAIVDTMRERRGATSVSAMPPGDAWLYVEFSGADHHTVRQRAAQLVSAMHARGTALAARHVEDPGERSQLWRVREDGAGLSAIRSDGTRTWSGWEDAAVAPEQLADYLNDFRPLLAEHGLTGVLYGHFGAGCVHVRIDFDLWSPQGREVMRTFVLEAGRLVARHGGSVSGEHGDGRARSELLALMYGPSVLSAFRSLKEIWDPADVLNPGILVDPAPLDADIAIPGPPIASTFALLADGHDLGAAAGRCVGIGKCVSHTGGVMCPSYRATGEERDSTRGRARALQTWAATRSDPSAPSMSDDDVRRTLDLCLSCKACSTDCPTSTDIATYKSEFTHRYYRWRLRPRSHYSLGWLPAFARLAPMAATAVNKVLAAPTLGRQVARAAGITERRSLPTFATRRAIRSELEKVPTTGGRALLFVDSFTRAFRPELIGSAVRVLDDAGIDVRLAPSSCCALTLISTGQLGLARRVLARTSRRLGAPALRDLPIVVLEPSCASALSHDLPALLPGRDSQRVASRVMTFDQALHQLADADWTPPRLPRRGVLQTHCHEYATLKSHRQGDSLRRRGMDQLVEATGCCGVAGNFGFEADHYELSIAVARQALVPALDGLRRGEHTPVLADGFGCASQIEHLRPDHKPLHLAQLLDQLMRRSEAPGSE